MKTMTKSQSQTGVGVGEHLRLLVEYDGDVRVFDLPLQLMPAADRDRAITAAAQAFAEIFNNEVARARVAHALALFA